jgi:hypothetical protein
MTKKMLFIILLILGIITTLLLITQTTIFRSRANSNDQLPVRENSYIFASPIQAKADGKEKIRITVFLLNSQGLGVGKQQVSIKMPPNIEIETLQSTTDDLGKATFNLSTGIPGKYEISASTPNLNLSQKINLLFLQ